MKKYLSIAFLLLSFLFLASCESETKTIVFLTNRTDLKNSLLKEMKEQFQDDFSDKGWEVRVETITDYENIVSTRLSGRNYGDVLLIPQTVEPQNLDRFFYSFGKTDEMERAGWRGVNTKAFQNQTYGLPIGLQSAGIMINLDVFDKAGVDPSTLKTPEAFLSAMETIKVYGNQNIPDFKMPFHSQTATGWGLSQWAAGITTAAGSKDYLNLELPWDNKAFWDNDLNEPGRIGKMYQLLFDLIANDLVESSPTIDSWEESKIWFAQGKVAAMAVGTWAIMQFEEVAESIKVGSSENIGYMPYPFTASDGEIYASISADYTVGVAKNTNNREIADAFAKWLVEDFNYAAKTGNIPPKSDAVYPAKIQSFSDAGVILVEDTPSPLNLEGSLYLAEKNAKSSATDEKRIALWDSIWMSDFAATAFDVRDNRSNKTIKDLLQAIQQKWDNGVAEVVRTYGPKVD